MFSVEGQRKNVSKMIYRNFLCYYRIYFNEKKKLVKLKRLYFFKLPKQQQNQGKQFTNKPDKIEILRN